MRKFEQQMDSASVFPARAVSLRWPPSWHHMEPRIEKSKKKLSETSQNNEQTKEKLSKRTSVVVLKRLINKRPMRPNIFFFIKVQCHLFITRYYLLILQHLFSAEKSVVQWHWFLFFICHTFMSHIIKQILIFSKLQ